MSERELHRIEVLTEVVERRRTIASAAVVLSLSVRQVQRIMQTFCAEGAPALRHRGRGRRSNNRIKDGVRDLALQLIRERYADFGPTLAAEKLAEEGFSVSRETLRKWMSDAGLWLSRKQHGRFASRGCGANVTANWCRSMAVITAGSRIVASPARCLSSSTTRPDS